MDILARIKLAPGRVGFYDPLSRIHLTLGRPFANVVSGTNCANLRRNVKTGVLSLIDGTLGGDIPPFKIVQDEKGTRLVSNGEEVNKPIVGRIEPSVEYPGAGHVELDPREKNGFGNEDRASKRGDEISPPKPSSEDTDADDTHTEIGGEEDSQGTGIEDGPEESPKKKKATKKK